MGELTLFTGILSAIISYLIGSVSSAVIISKILFHDDVRLHGSGNAGATNMNRNYGAKAGSLTLGCDLLKTALAMLISQAMVGEWGGLIGYVACFIGHCLPVFFGFRGGKGVSVCFCAALVLDWRLFLIMAILFILIVYFTRYVSLASIIAVFSLIPASWAFGYSHAPETFAGIFAFITVTFAHRSNIKRLLSGTESKFSLKSNK